LDLIRSRPALLSERPRAPRTDSCWSGLRGSSPAVWGPHLSNESSLPLPSFPIPTHSHAIVLYSATALLIAVSCLDRTPPSRTLCLQPPHRWLAPQGWGRPPGPSVLCGLPA